LYRLRRRQGQRPVSARARAREPARLRHRYRGHARRARSAAPRRREARHGGRAEQRPRSADLPRHRNDLLTDTRRMKKLAAAVCGVIGGAVSAAAQAGPGDAQVVAGAGTITRSGSETLIEQTTDRLAIDWQSFDLAADEA